MSSTENEPTWDLNADASRHSSKPSGAASNGDGVDDAQSSDGEPGTPGDGPGLHGLSYEEALSEVRDITRSLQDGTVSVDRLLTAADRGRALLALCERRLSSVEKGLI